MKKQKKMRNEINFNLDTEEEARKYTTEEGERAERDEKGEAKTGEMGGEG